MAYILDLRVDVGVVTGIFTFPTLGTLTLIIPFLTLLLIHMHSTLGVSIGSLLPFSSSQFFILLGRTFNPLKGGGD